jgi:hypothetical protein
MGEPCGSAVVDDQGQATFVVPVIGTDPKIQLKADLTTTVGGKLHFYSGSITISGCVAGEAEISGTIDLELSHGSSGGMSGFIAGLGAGPSGSGGSGGSVGSGAVGGTFSNPFGSDDDDKTGARGCGCRTPVRSTNDAGLAALLALSWMALGRRRRQSVD